MRLPTISPWGRIHDEHYNRVLQRTYPDCRMRWSERSHTWRLERKAMYERLNINPAKYPAEAVDTFICMRDGFYLAGEYPARSLPPVERLVSYLISSDPDRMDLGAGTPEERAERFMNMVEEREALGVEKARRANTFVESGAGSDLYDQLAWEEGRRVSVPRSLPAA